MVVSIFVDLKRAFETIRKLEKYGMQAVMLDLIKDYLSNRYHKTRIEKATWSKILSNFGVPQGTVMGPLCL